MHFMQAKKDIQNKPKLGMHIHGIKFGPLSVQCALDSMFKPLWYGQ
jgi:hypothetical protein